MQQLYDEMKKKERDDALESAKHTAISAGEIGGIYGSLNALLYGEPSLSGVLRRGVGSGLTSAALGAGAAYLGHKLIGPPADDNPAAYSQQGALGGAVSGGLLGAGAGHLLGSGKLNWIHELPGAKAAYKAAETALPLKNMVTDFVKRQARHPSTGGGLKTALLLGGLGAGIGGLEGLSTGMDQDLSRNLAEEDQHARA